MKKLIPAFCVFLLAGASAGSQVIDGDPENSGSVSVNYNGGISYKVTIPASVTFKRTEKSLERPLSATDVVLGDCSELNVRVSSKNGFKMINGSGYIEYSMLVNGHEVADSENITVLTVKQGENSNWAVLTFSTEFLGENTGLVGNYSDTLTFTVEVT